MAQTVFRQFANIITVLILFATPATLSAAGLSVTPMLQEVVVESEPEVTTEITLTNTTATPMTFQLAAYDFGNLDKSGGVAFLGAGADLKETYGLAQWMKLSRETISLPAGASESVEVTIENDATLSPGGHYGAVVFTSEGERGAGDDNAIAINQMLASLIFAKKTEGANPAIELIEQMVERKPLSLGQMQLTFRNPGNVHAVPRGRVRVFDPIGRETQRGIINEASSLVLPEQERVFVTALSPVMTAWLPGWYEIQTEYRFDGRDAFENASTRRLLVPPVSLAVAAVALALWIGLRFWRKRQRKVCPKEDML